MREFFFDLQRFVVGTSGNDNLTVASGISDVLAYGGNDSIYNSTNSSYTVNGGWGYVTGDADNDLISLTGSYWRNTINGGDGNDLIYNWSSNDTLIITGGANWSKSTVSNNVVRHNR